MRGGIVAALRLTTIGLALSQALCLTVPGVNEKGGESLDAAAIHQPVVSSKQQASLAVRLGQPAAGISPSKLT